MTCANSGQLRRWGIFNVVGVLGFAVQLTALFVLKRFCGLGYLAATAAAVEIAVLHNFVWHERVTWFDVRFTARHGVWKRLIRFHFANGLISIGGNVILTWIFVAGIGLSYLPANAVGVLICSVINFVAGDRYIFRGGHTPTICRAE